MGGHRLEELDGRETLSEERGVGRDMDRQCEESLP